MSSLTLDHTKDNDQRSSKQSHTPLATVNEPDRTPSPTPSEELDDEELSIPEDPVISYGLRKNIDRKRVTTFIDEDRTGDFDPAEEARKEAQKRIESKARKQSKAKGKGKGKGKQKAVEVPKEFVRKLIVRLKFEAFGNVLNVTNSTDNWPDGHSILDTEDEHEQEERRTYFRQSTPGREPQIPVKDPYGELDDLTGYPEARGCKCCRQHLQHCSAIETGEFPCAQCTADDVDCHPLIEPKVKGRCKQCIERGTEACSYETEDCQGVQCDECFEDDIICEAGLPPSRYTVNRADIDRVMRGPDRKWVDCTNCRMLKKRCSIKKKSDKGPCKGCKKEKVPCTFYSTPIFELSRKKQGKKKVVENGESSNTAATSTGYLNIKDIAPDVHMPDSTFFSPSDLEDLEKASSDDDNGNDDDTAMRDPSPEIELEDAEGRKGTMREIRTSFAHPIKFCTGTVDDYVPDCNFCEMPAYSFVGSFERTPLVIPWPNGAGFTEIAGGHRETGDGATTMCQTCTFARLQILACEAHDVHPMPSLIPASDDFDTAAEELISAEPRSRAFQEQLLRWCSMCFSPATHGCCATQPSILGGEDDEMMEGCGLRLCGRCEKEFREVFVGDSSAMATAFDREKKAREGDEEALKVVRADVGFLKSDGLLMRSVEG
ncbi:hypothetical protein P280DRAFT_403171 [Massarina eburnea CBS 473.64]|uniref:Uncharacterized protein n=1 Tax=Massarina eburnea CBS 473.64 TaxID=1395130 RepID=A0A6A6RU44_9PLEO|nr:hypothetical protein P280DRAFT_403171 [Massarina eburnea CBS 473.64]